MWFMDARRNAPWITADKPSSMGIAITSTQPSGPPTMNTMATNTRMNGRSEIADSVADAKNSRTSSICDRWCA